MLQGVEVGQDVKVSVERKVAKSAVQQHLSATYGLSPDARARSTSLQQAEAGQGVTSRYLRTLRTSKVLLLALDCKTPSCRAPVSTSRYLEVLYVCVALQEKREQRGTERATRAM